MSHSVVNAEHYPSVTSAVFADAEQAQQTISALERDAPFTKEQIDLVSPDDANVAQKLESGGTNIFRTILRSHASLGIIGGLIGLVLASFFVLGGFAFARSSATWTYILFIAFGITFGMLAAGVVSIRPDREPTIMQAERAARQGWWTVVVHAQNAQQKKRAEDILGRHGMQTAGSL